MQGLTKWMPNWKARGWKTADRKPVKNQDLWQALDAAEQRHKIDWRWVQGHNGDPGKEEADRLDNEGVLMATASGVLQERSEERREGTGGVSTCRSGWTTAHEKKNKQRYRRAKSGQI